MFNKEQMFEIAEGIFEDGGSWQEAVIAMALRFRHVATVDIMEAVMSEDAFKDATDAQEWYDENQEAWVELTKQVGLYVAFKRIQTGTSIVCQTHGYEFCISCLRDELDFQTPQPAKVQQFTSYSFLWLKGDGRLHVRLGSGQGDYARIERIAGSEFLATVFEDSAEGWVFSYEGSFWSAGHLAWWLNHNLAVSCEPIFTKTDEQQLKARQELVELNS